MLRRHTAGGMKGGVGTASLRVGDVVVGALAVVNAAGDVLDWRKGQIVAGARRPDGKGFADIVEVIKRTIGTPSAGDDVVDDPSLRSTTLVVVATNVDADQDAADEGRDDGQLRRRARRSGRITRPATAISSSRCRRES